MLALTFASVAELFVQTHVLHFIPANANTHFEAIVGEQGNLGGLLGRKHSLTLGQNHYRGDHLQPLGHSGNKGKSSQWFMEGHVFIVGAAKAAFTIWVGAKHVVVDQQMGNTQCFHALGERLDVRWIGSYFVVRKHRAQLHAVQIHSPLL